MAFCFNSVSRDNALGHPGRIAPPNIMSFRTPSFNRTPPLSPPPSPRGGSRSKMVSLLSKNRLVCMGDNRTVFRSFCKSLLVAILLFVFGFHKGGPDITFSRPSVSVSTNKERMCLWDAERDLFPSTAS